jgi:hypothetical protein
MREMIKSSLTDSIRTLYPDPISDMEAQEAASNLLGFMELLVEIDNPHRGITSQHEVQPCR